MNHNKPRDARRRLPSAPLIYLCAAAATALLFADGSSALHPSLVAASACLAVYLGERLVPRWLMHPTAAFLIPITLLAVPILAWRLVPPAVLPDWLLPAWLGIFFGVVPVGHLRHSVLRRLEHAAAGADPIELAQALQEARGQVVPEQTAVCTVRCLRDAGTGSLEVRTGKSVIRIPLVVPARLDEASMGDWVRSALLGGEPLLSVNTDTGEWLIAVFEIWSAEAA